MELCSECTIKSHHKRLTGYQFASEKFTWIFISGVDENGGNLLRMETFIGAERPCNIIDYMHEKSNIGNVNWPESRIGHRAAFQERPNLYEFDLPTPILGHKKFQFEITPCHGDGKDAGNSN